MASLYNKLGDSFDQHSGQLSEYTDGSLVQLSLPKHYNIRSFYSTDISVPQTMLDLSFWNAFNYTGQTMDQLSQRRSIVGSTFRRHTQDEYSIGTGGLGATTYQTQSQMNSTPQYNLDFASVSAGNEDWPSGDANVVVGKDSAYRYSNSIRITLASGVLKTVASYYHDDISTDFNDDTYYIELVLRSFPAQAAGAHLDLANSFIDFSVDQTFSPATTNSIPFNQSLNDLTGGGDVTFRIPRSLLTNVDLTQLNAIRFRLLATGGAMTFIAQAMRLVPSTWSANLIAIDTKRGFLSRNVPRAGGSESNNIFGTMLFHETRPEDVDLTFKFNSGHIPTGSDNTLRIYVRYVDVNNNISYILSSRNTGTTITINQILNGVQTTLFTGSIALVAETDYYGTLSVHGGLINTSIYSVDGNFLGTILFSSGDQTIGLIGRGRVGYSFEPYNYDFTIEFISATTASFARFQSSTFASRTSVIGASLSTISSQPINLIDDGTMLIESGDATTSTGTIGQPSPSIQIDRSGTSWYGGIQQDFASWLGDPSQVFIEGDIYPVATVRGLYRVALVDVFGSVGWMGSITGMLPNQWNHFQIPVSYNLLPVGFRLYIHQAGFYDDQFYIDNLQMNHLTIDWEASADNGVHWQPFSTSINETYSGIRFLRPGTNLSVRATATSDRSWIEGYELIPHYGWGQGGVSTAVPTIASSTFNVRVTGQQSSTISSSYDVRFNGPLTITKTADVRLTGQASTNRVNDARINGTNGSSTSYGVRLNQSTSGQPTGLLLGILQP